MFVPENERTGGGADSMVLSAYRRDELRENGERESYSSTQQAAKFAILLNVFFHAHSLSLVHVSEYKPWEGPVPDGQRTSWHGKLIHASSASSPVGVASR